MPTYIPRIIDEELRDRLAYAGAVVIEGPRACGKTISALHTAASAFYADDQQAALAASWPELVTTGNRPRLIDEWQVRPETWNLVRRAVDAAGEPGQFILTGSAAPPGDVTRHAGAGRMSRIRMRPMSTYERRRTPNAVSLRSLLNGDRPTSNASSITFHEIVHEIMIGGWPANMWMDTLLAQRRMRDYLEESIRADVALDPGGIRRRDPQRLRALFRSLARSAGAALNVSTIAADIQRSGVEVSRQTAQSYLEALERVMLLELIPAWQTHLRSRARLRSNPKYYLVDPSLSIAALDAAELHLERDLELTGQLFEQLVMRDLLVYAQRADANVYYYRDSNGLEVDAIIERLDGTWMAIEVKLGMSAVEQAARSLLSFANNIDVERKGHPTALVVVTGTGPCYIRHDGVIVIPFELLAP